MKHVVTLIGLALLLSNNGCGLLIAHNAIERHYDVRDREVEYRHQERMRELQIQEKRLQQSQPQQDGGAIVRDNPF